MLFSQESYSDSAVVNKIHTTYERFMNKVLACGWNIHNGDSPHVPSVPI